MVTEAPPVPLQRVAARRQTVEVLNALMALRDTLGESLTAASTARTRLYEATPAEALAPTGEVTQEAAA